MDYIYKTKFSNLLKSILFIILYDIYFSLKNFKNFESNSQKT